MFEFNYSFGDIRNSDLGEGIICSGEGSGGKGEGSGGKGEGKWGKRAREVGVRGREVGNAYPPVHPLSTVNQYLCTSFHQKQKTALPESAEGREWPQKTFHDQCPQKNVNGRAQNHDLLITSRTRILLQLDTHLTEPPRWHRKDIRCANIYGKYGII